MNKLQVIKSIDGKDEYVLLPFAVYYALQKAIEDKLAELNPSVNDDEYVPFDPADYVENPVALARINAGISREELASRLGVSSSYIGKIECRAKVTDKMLARVKAILPKKQA